MASCSRGPAYESLALSTADVGGAALNGWRESDDVEGVSLVGTDSDAPEPDRGYRHSWLWRVSAMLTAGLVTFAVGVVWSASRWREFGRTKPLSSGNEHLRMYTETSAACRTVLPVDSEYAECFGGVRWAMEHGVKEHRDWYIGLKPDSSFAAFQSTLHERGAAGCPTPCGLSYSESHAAEVAAALAAPACADTVTAENFRCTERIAYETYVEGLDVEAAREKVVVEFPRECAGCAAPSATPRPVAMGRRRHSFGANYLAAGAVVMKRIRSVVHNVDAYAHTCEDLPGKRTGARWFDGTNGCAEYEAHNFCDAFGAIDFNGNGAAKDQCCACGGGMTNGEHFRKSINHISAAFKAFLVKELSLRYRINQYLADGFPTRRVHIPFLMENGKRGREGLYRNYNFFLEIQYGTNHEVVTLGDSGNNPLIMSSFSDLLKSQPNIEIVQRNVREPWGRMAHVVRGEVGLKQADGWYFLMKNVTFFACTEPCDDNIGLGMTARFVGQSLNRNLWSSLSPNGGATPGFEEVPGRVYTDGEDFEDLALEAAEKQRNEFGGPVVKLDYTHNYLVFENNKSGLCSTFWMKVVPDVVWTTVYVTELHIGGELTQWAQGKSGPAQGPFNKKGTLALLDTGGGPPFLAWGNVPGLPKLPPPKVRKPCPQGTWFADPNPGAGYKNCVCHFEEVTFVLAGEGSDDTQRVTITQEAMYKVSGVQGKLNVADVPTLLVCEKTSALAGNYVNLGGGLFGVYSTLFDYETKTVCIQPNVCADDPYFGMHHMVSHHTGNTGVASALVAAGKHMIGGYDVSQGCTRKACSYSAVRPFCAATCDMCI